MLIINHCQHNPNKECTVFQGEKSKMKKTVVRDFIKIMKSLDIFIRDNWNKTESVYTFGNGSYIEFVGLDMPDIGKGFRRDIVYFNEANKGRITHDTFVQIQSRSFITYLDYNPDKSFWAHTEVIEDKNTEFLILTFHDNEYLPEGEKDSILRYRDKGYHDPHGSYDKEENIKHAYWANKWRVYGLGLVGRLDGVIYSDWHEIDTVPKDAEYIGTGLDFGFTNDPSAAIDLYRYNSELILDEVFSRKGLSNRDIANGLKGDINRIVYADSAEPKSIAEIRAYGIRILPADKGKDSVSFGIEILQDFTLRPTKRSTNMIKSLEGYMWKIARDGKVTNIPHHDNSDESDAVRYCAIMKLKKAGTGKLTIF